jgi:hypothetical protein
VIQRDYIDRLIEQCAQALARMLQRRRAGEMDAALREFGEAADTILGPLRPLVDRMEPDSAVAFVGPNQIDRIRLYASLLGEEGIVHRSRGDGVRAHLSWRRALELYAAVSLAGGRLDSGDRARIAFLTTVVDVADLDERYRDELGRLAS